MSIRNPMQAGSPYEVDREDDEQPGKGNRDRSQRGEETGKKSRREVDPPVKRQPNKPAP